MAIHQIKKNLSGSAIVYGLIVTAFSMTLLISILRYITIQINFSINRVEKEQAFQIAESGIFFYRWYLAHETSGKTAQQIDDFWNTGNPIGVNINGNPNYPYEAEWKDSEGQAIGKYRLEVTKPDPGSTIVTIKSLGWTYKNPSVKRTIQVRYRRPSWSEYVFLSNSFMNFGNQAVVYGKIHSNTGIRFDGVAYNLISSLVPTFDDPTYGGNGQEFGVHTTTNPVDPNAPSYPWPDGTVPERPDIFKGGREFPTPEVSFNGVMTDLAYMKSQSQTGHGKYFDNSGQGRRINLKSNGTYDVCTVESANVNTHAISRYLTTTGSGTCNSCSGACLANYSIPNDGVIFVENNVWLEGTVNNKRIAVVAGNLSGGGDQRDIYIGISNSNLRVATYDCNNRIGLVAQRDVRILNDCPDDFVVDAALLAQSGTVGINDNGFSGKSSLTFNGSIASYLQPYFQHGNSGFAVRTYNYDNNLLYCPPPFFPTGTEYKIDLWEELE